MNYYPSALLEKSQIDSEKQFINMKHVIHVPVPCTNLPVNVFFFFFKFSSLVFHRPWNSKELMNWDSFVKLQLILAVARRRSVPYLFVTGKYTDKIVWYNTILFAYRISFQRCYFPILKIGNTCTWFGAVCRAHSIITACSNFAVT